MYAVAMARNLEVQVENKQVKQYRVQEWVTATAKDVQSSYSKLMEVCTIGMSPPPLSLSLSLLFFPLLLIDLSAYHPPFLSLSLSLTLSLSLSGTCHDLVRTDQKWLATLDSSHWLHYVK